MATTTVNVSFPKRLLKQMDRVAKAEARNRSELLREAVRMYVDRKQRWQRLLTFWQSEARRMGVKPADVDAAIQEYRRGLRSS